MYYRDGRGVMRMKPHTRDFRHAADSEIQATPNVSLLLVELEGSRKFTLCFGVN